MRQPDAPIEELRRVNRALRTLSAGNRTLLRVSGEDELLRGMCRVIVEEGGYRFAGVFFAERDEDKRLPLMAYTLAKAGDREEVAYFDALHLSWAETELGNSAPALAVRSGQPCIGRNLLTDPDLAPWRADALRFGYGSTTAFPLRIDDEIIGALCIAAEEPDAFDEAEVRLLGELADDLAYGIANLRTRIKHQQAEATIQRMAFYDPLTGLANRALLREQLQAAITTARQARQPLALLLLRVGHLQDINDTLGYEEGNRLLQDFAGRLSQAAREGQFVARATEAEFALLVPGADAEHATRTAKLLNALLSEPMEVSGLRVDSLPTIGIALFPGHGADADTLIRRARVAMFHAERTHQDYSVFSLNLDQECVHRLALMGDLRRAISNNELSLYCQPKVHMSTNRVCGAEALLRWPRAAQGMVTTAEFIKLAEHVGLICPLTCWVLEAAFRQCYDWHEGGFQDRPLSINLSAQDLRHPRLVDRIKGLFATWGAEPEWVQFEVTESAMMEDPARTLDTLAQLKGLGVKLAVDDFGIGYSSLAYLQELPVDTLKIDQFFVARIADNPASAAIVRSTVELGHRLDLEVVAEGVETQAAWDCLAELGCDVAQGYFISTPMPAENFRQWQRDSSWA
jgi:diguanylate cyclase (GGDEF)-like protein